MVSILTHVLHMKIEARAKTLMERRVVGWVMFLLHGKNMLKKLFFFHTCMGKLVMQASRKDGSSVVKTLICQPSIGMLTECRHVDRVSVDISTDMSTRSQLSVGQHVI